MTLESAFAGACKHIERKLKENKFVVDTLNFDWDDEKNYIDGDPESIHTIGSLYQQFLTKEDGEKLTEMLYNKFG